MTVASRYFRRTLKLGPVTTNHLRVERDLRVPMTDGVVLLADRYAPGGRPPLVLVRSPYGRRGIWGLILGRLLAERGFQVLIESCRGTFGSGGVFDPFGTDEHDDGLATIGWMQQQPWYPGSFATVGPSYLGMVQWAIAADAGPDLAAMATQVTTSDFRTPFYAGESFSLETALIWVHQVATQERRLAFLRQALAERRLKAVMNRLPLRDLDRLATGLPVPYYQEWLTGSDAYWKGRSFASTLDRVTAPVNMVGGWFDFFLPLQLRDYAARRAAGHEPYLTIGPWRHADQEAMGAWVSESLAWLRAHLLGDRGGLRPDPVRVFVTGAEEWRELPGWPPPTAPQRWHLQPDGALGPGLPAAGEPDRYRYDPADPTPNLGGPVGYTGRARVDNRILEARPDVLTYTGAPLGADLEVMGEVSVDLFVRSSLEHTDFFARLCEVDPAGRSTSATRCSASFPAGPRPSRTARSGCGSRSGRPRTGSAVVTGSGSRSPAARTPGTPATRAAVSRWAPRPR